MFACLLSRLDIGTPSELPQTPGTHKLGLLAHTLDHYLQVEAPRFKVVTDWKLLYTNGKGQQYIERGKGGNCEVVELFTDQIDNENILWKI